MAFYSKGLGKPAPVETGKEYEVDIKEVSRRGEGLARIQGFVVFVPNTKPGDHVKIKIKDVRSRFAQGEVI
jgi:predicted RNA-binding protein with TRAM domain